MIRDRKAWEEWERKWQRCSPAKVEENMRVFWTLLKMARDAGSWPPSNPLEEIEVDIELARKINTYVEPPERSGPEPR